MRIAVLAPIQNSLYSRLVTHLAAMENGIDVALISGAHALVADAHPLRAEPRRYPPARQGAR